MVLYRGWYRIGIGIEQKVWSGSGERYFGDALRRRLRPRYRPRPRFQYVGSIRPPVYKEECGFEPVPCGGIVFEVRLDGKAFDGWGDRSGAAAAAGPPRLPPEAFYLTREPKLAL